MFHKFSSLLYEKILITTEATFKKICILLSADSEKEAHSECKKKLTV